MLLSKPATLMPKPLPCCFQSCCIATLLEKLLPPHLLLLPMCSYHDAVAATAHCYIVATAYNGHCLLWCFCNCLAFVSWCIVCSGHRLIIGSLLLAFLVIMLPAPLHPYYKKWLIVTSFWLFFPSCCYLKFHMSNAYTYRSASIEVQRGTYHGGYCT